MIDGRYQFTVLLQFEITQKAHMKRVHQESRDTIAIANSSKHTDGNLHNDAMCLRKRTSTSVVQPAYAVLT